MCVIIDVNVFHLFLDDNDVHYGLLSRELFCESRYPVRLVYGGKLRREYLRSGQIRRALPRLDQAGRAKAIEDLPVDQEANTVEHLNTCVSDDQHIIALARVSKARILCSNDKDLHADFKNKVLIDNPRGKVYQSSIHHNLIKRLCP